MSPGEPVLLLCHSFPPNPGIGGRRWAKFAKELARRGHPVHVVHKAPRPGDKVSLWKDDAAHPNIFHHPVPSRYPEVMTRWPLTSLWDKLMYRFWIRVMRLRVSNNYYDESCLSRNDVLDTAGRLVRRYGIRQVVASGAPFHLLAYAAELKQATPQLHVAVDFRDAWTWGRHYGFSTMGPGRIAREQKLEAWLMESVDAVISPHAAILDHLHEVYGSVPRKRVLIPHTIDPDDLPVNTTPRNDGTFRMIYAGSLYGTEEAEGYFPALLEAFSTLQTHFPQDAARCRLDLYITGQGAETFRAQVSARRLDRLICFHDPLPPKEILVHLAQADLFPVFLPADKKDVMVTKLNELFHLHRPVLHVGELGTVGRAIVARRLGASVRVDELVTELPAIIRGERRLEVDPKADLSESLLAAVTSRLLEEVLC